MKSNTILLADSGSTKTDWCLLQNGKPKMFATQGINPFFMMENDILKVLQQELKINPLKLKLDEIHFYGAGIASDDKKKTIEKALKKYFQTKKVSSHSDMLASARATCQHTKGIACILGTGSNTSIYDGKKLGFKTPALGYVLGDEGGGTSLGKKVLQYYLHGIFDHELMQEFESHFAVSKDEILENVYRKPFPNRYLAKFTQFILDHRGHYMIENIAEDCLNDLFIHHLLRYPKIHSLPVHFTGSVAWHLKDIIKILCDQYEIKLGTVLQKPIKGLIKYHQTN
jgi:glucosamine kinase